PGPEQQCFKNSSNTLVLVYNRSGPVGTSPVYGWPGSRAGLEGHLVADGQETSRSPVPRQDQRIFGASATSAEVKPRPGTRGFREDSGLGFRDGNRDTFGACAADFRLIFEGPRKPTESGRPPFATFLVRLLPEGHDSAAGASGRPWPVLRSSCHADPRRPLVRNPQPRAPARRGRPDAVAAGISGTIAHNRT